MQDVDMLVFRDGLARVRTVETDSAVYPSMRPDTRVRVERICSDLASNPSSAAA